MEDQAANSQQLSTRMATTQDGTTASGSPAHADNTDRSRRVGRAVGQPKTRVACRFYASKSGCRAGDACPYFHDQSLRSDVNNAPVEPSSPESQLQAETAKPDAPRRYQAPPVASSRVVSRPVPQKQAQDPRKFQLDQLRRRFTPSETEDEAATSLTFRLVPSDPDFPFELEVGLQCVLIVPKTYPKAQPRLKVMNKEMGRGYQINLENGFSKIVEKMPNSTLLGFMNNLDRQLEALLTGEKAETIKLVRNTGPTVEPVPELEPPPPSPPLPEPAQPVSAGPRYSTQQLYQAETKRKADTRQLEARLGRLPLFEKASDGLSYVIPFEPRRKMDLPVPLQNVRTTELFVPRLYPLEPCRITLFGVQREVAENTEENFLRYVKQNEKSNLLGFINYLAANMHKLAVTPVVKDEEEMPKPSEKSIPEMTKLQVREPGTNATESEPKPETVRGPVITDPDRPHVQHIARPPEWSVPAEEDESDSYSDSYSDRSESGDEADGQSAADRATGSEGPERGIMISFPYLELHGIELLEVVFLAVTVRCTRCKDTLDVERLRHATPKLESCKKCGQGFSIGFRRELLHTNNVRAGYLDLDGCTVLDMLPSQFIPTCATCSTAQAAPGFVSVRGQSTMAICRECHSRMSFTIPEVKFLQISASVKKNRPPPRRKERENLGISAGTELPNRGRCEHYRKSYRWFRFSCCQKVFPCDRCHDATADHINEHANRMICGWCSREQLYRPDTCAFCRNSVVRRRGGGFWEGGKGTREKNLMSRKDPRKYKRRPGTQVGSGGVAKK